MNETSPDEDVLATDCDVRFAEGAVSVQVKCTSQFTMAASTASWPIEESWLRKWDQALNPVYFLLVVVPPGYQDWLEHLDTGTIHRTAAFWRRIKVSEINQSITVSKNQRLTIDTLDKWRDDLIAAHTPGGRA